MFKYKTAITIYDTILILAWVLAPFIAPITWWYLLLPMILLVFGPIFVALMIGMPLHILFEDDLNELH